MLCLIFFLSCFFAAGGSAYANSHIPQSLIPKDGIIPNAGEDNPCNLYTGEISFQCIGPYIGYLILFFLGMAGGFFFFGILVGGYRYMLGSFTGGGTDAAKKEILARIVGFLVIIFSYAIIDTIIKVLTVVPPK